MVGRVTGGGDTGSVEVITWHHGLIARWWSNFNLDGPEIEFFRPFVQAGQPALDVACGTGRLLVPWVADGLDVDGVDASADMVAGCREAARRLGRSPILYVQPTHLLDLPRRYGAVVMCGGFGLGATREQDREGLRRVFAHLRPGGVLALDYEVNEFDDERWRAWRPREADHSPPEPQDRRLGADGFEYALRHRVAAVDPNAKRVTRELQAWQWRDGELVAHEIRLLVANLYSAAEIVAVLGAAGFDDLRVVGGYHGDEPTGSEQFLVYVAHRPFAAG
jgi:SAM-dependent methyltransferase